jgi:hypothetical protein
MMVVSVSDHRHREATMKTRQIVALSLIAGFALGAAAMQLVHAEDTYVRKLPIDALTVPVPIIPPGSALDLRPTRAPDASDHITGYTPLTREPATPSIGLSIKSPFEDRK